MNLRQGIRTVTMLGTAAILLLGADSLQASSEGGREHSTHLSCLQAQNNRAPYPVAQAHMSQAIEERPPVVGPSFHIGGDPVSLVGTGPSHHPNVVFNGSNYLVVWQQDTEGNWDIRGTRISSTGEILDLGGIAIAGGDAVQDEPAACFDGTNYMVVWREFRDGAMGIYGARVAVSGEVLDGEGILLSIAGRAPSSPAISFDGVNYTVVWDDWSDGYKGVFGTRVSPAGVVLDPERIDIANSARRQEAPAIAFDGTNYMVVWQDEPGGSDIYGARVGTNGEVLDPGGKLISPSIRLKRDPAIAFDGTNYLVIWEDELHNTWHDVYGTRVSPSGAVLDPAGIAISTASQWQLFPTLAFDGVNYMVVWVDWRNGPAAIYGARVTPSGAVLDPFGIAISTALDWREQAAIAFDGANYMTFWWMRRDGSENIFGARLNPSGEVLGSDEVIVSTRVNEQMNSAAASDGTDYMVVWEDDRSGISKDIFGSRVTASGAVLDPLGISVSTVSGDQSAPAIASDGMDYLAVWQDLSTDDGDIRGARISSSGELLDPGGIVISDAALEQSKPAVAFDGTNYMVVWEDVRAGSRDIYGTRVTSSGAVLDPEGIAVSISDGFQTHPAISSDGTSFMVAWCDGRNDEGHPDIYATCVAQSGTVDYPDGVALSVAENSQDYPATSFDGTNFIVVWQDDRNGEGQFDIYGTRVTPSGAALDPDGIPISTAVLEQSHPAMAFIGSNCVVVWEDGRGVSKDIYGTRMTPSGTVLEPDGLLVASEPCDQASPTVASSTSGGVLVAYSSFTPELCSNRIWGNVLTPPAPLQATVDMVPHTVNLMSRGRHISCYVELPEGNSPADIDVGTVILNDAIPAELSPVVFGDYDSDGIPDLMIKFSRSALIALLGGVDGSSLWLSARSAGRSSFNHGDELEVTLSGELTDGTAFVGTDTIKVVDPGVRPEDIPVLKIFPTLVVNEARFSYEVPVEGTVTLRVYDAAGRLVRILVGGQETAGGHEVTWDRKTYDGRRVGPGVYFVRFELRGRATVEKLLVLD